MKKNISKLLVLFLLFTIQINAQEFETAVNAISSSLKTVKNSKKSFQQKIEIVQLGVVKITIDEVDSKGKSILKTYQFNLSDVQENTVKKIVKKDLIYVQVLVKNKQKLILQSVNGEKQSYIDNFKVYAEDINNGRNIVDKIKNAIPLATQVTDSRLTISSYNDYFNWLENNIGEVNLTKNQFTQKLTNNTNHKASVKIAKTIKTDKSSKLNLYKFNLSTLNPNTVNFKIEGEIFNISIETKGALKTIQYFVDGEQNNYINKLTIACSGIEQARDMQKVFKGIIPLAKESFENSLESVTDVSQGVNLLNEMIQSLSINNENITQSIKGDCIVDFNQEINSDKKSNQNEYGFNFGDIDKHKIKYYSKGQYLFIDISTKGGENFIKFTNNGEPKNYTNTSKIYMSAIEETLIFKHLLENVIELCAGDENEDTEKATSNDDNESSSSSIVERSQNCEPSKSVKQTNGDFVDLYGGRIRSGGFGSNDKSIYSLYIGQIDGGKKGTTIICTLNEPVENKKDYNDAVNNFLNENNLKTSVLELTLNGKTLRIPATECKQKPTKFLGDISGYFVTFEGDILKDQIKMMQDYDLQRFRLIIGGHPYERFFKKPTKRTNDLKGFFNCVEMNNIFEIKKKDATKMDLSEVNEVDYNNIINGKWVLQGTNGAVTEFDNGKIIFSKMGVKSNEGSYKIVGKRVIISTNNGNSISEISMFLRDMLILKEKGVEKTYERID